MDQVSECITFLKVLVAAQDGDIGTPWTHLLHGKHQITLIYRTITPEEKLRADWTVSTQRYREWQRGQQKRWRYIKKWEPSPLMLCTTVEKDSTEGSRRDSFPLDTGEKRHALTDL